MTAPRLVFGADGALIAAYASPQDATTDNQEQILIGGSNTLKPETSTEYTVGGVFTPRFAPGLSLEIDYYNDTISNTILSGGYADASTSPGPDLLLNGCYGPAQNQTFCDLIVRNAAGTIVQYQQPQRQLRRREGVGHRVRTDLRHRCRPPRTCPSRARSWPISSSTSC